MSREQFLSRWRGNSGGWAVVLLDPGPPPSIKRGTMQPIQCPGGVCPPQGRYFPNAVYPQLMPPLSPSLVAPSLPSQSAPVPDSVTKWYTRPNQPGLFLYRGETLLGRFDEKTGVYTNMQGEIDSPSIELIAGEKLNYGVDTSRIPQKQSYEVNGVEVGREKAFEAFGDGLVDDSAHRFLTLVADDVTRRKFKSDCQSDAKLKALLKDIKVNAYDPGHWVVRSRQLPAGLTLQNANGEIVRTIEYQEPKDAVELIEGRFPLFPPIMPKIQFEGFWIIVALIGVVFFRDTILRGTKSVWTAITSGMKSNSVSKDELAALLAEIRKANQDKQSNS
jgi:hypothetical protein